MHSRNHIIWVILLMIVVCLMKIAFFPGHACITEIIPSAHADGGIVEWNKGLRIVTASTEGATTYVWDYEGKTRVRKYYIEKGKLKLKVFNLVADSK